MRTLSRLRLPVNAPLRATLPRPAAEVSGGAHAALDGVYIAVGVGLTQWDPANRMLHGFGWAVVVQGAFLLMFDAWHGWRLPRVVRLTTEQEITHK